jgi:malonate-semialdehyde dehydrogenase (acetylating)/methylmalonate-semialdehyde dehydrogenase
VRLCAASTWWSLLAGSLSCGKDAVDALLAHPDIQAVSFVGSTPIARYIYQRGAQLGKRTQALGGAKNHLVVMPDEDIEQAVDGLIGAAYGSAGERCMAISVAVLVGDVADKVVPMLRKRATELKIGDGMTPGVEMGPIVTRQALERIENYIEVGVSEGAALVLDGRGYKSRIAPRVSSLAPHYSITSPPTCVSTGRKSSDLCCAVCASRTSRRR